jgi:outer membrane protein
VNWDVQLALTVPIFQGGVIQSQVRQAESVVRQYRLLLSQSRRSAEQEIRTFFDLLNADRKQVEKLSELVEISKKNYETQIAYYRNGLVTNLDVLQAMTTYQDAQRQLARQRFSFQLDSVKLQAATGERTEINIKTKVNP